MAPSVWRRPPSDHAAQGTGGCLLFQTFSKQGAGQSRPTSAPMAAEVGDPVSSGAAIRTRLWPEGIRANAVNARPGFVPAS